MGSRVGIASLLIYQPESVFFLNGPLFIAGWPLEWILARPSTSLRYKAVDTAGRRGVRKKSS